MAAGPGPQRPWAGDHADSPLLAWSPLQRASPRVGEWLLRPELVVTGGPPARPGPRSGPCSWDSRPGVSAGPRLWPCSPPWVCRWRPRLCVHPPCPLLVITGFGCLGAQSLPGGSRATPTFRQPEAPRKALGRRQRCWPRLRALLSSRAPLRVAAWARPWGALQPRCLPSMPTGSVRVTQGQPQAGPPRCGPCCWLYCHFDKDVNGVSCGPQVFVLGPLCGCATLALTVSPKCDRSLGLQCIMVPEGVGE